MRISVSRCGPLSGTLTLPGDKSISHRAVLLGALANGKSTFTNFLESGVTRVMTVAVKALGVNIDLKNRSLIVEGQGLDGLQPPQIVLDCGHSATTMRLLAGVLVAANIPAILDGSPGLRRRPMDRIIQPLSQMGALLIGENEQAPLKILPVSPEKPLKGITYSSPIPSAQVKSAILLAGLSATSQTTIIEHGPSRDHTERLLRAMGADVFGMKTNGEYRTTISPLGKTTLKPVEMLIPGDFSSGSFIMAAAANLPGSNIALRHIGLNWSRTGCVDALSAMGAMIKTQVSTRISFEEIGTITLVHSSLQSTTISGDLVVRMIDEFPAFAAAAAFAEGSTIVSDAEELRFKETDRIRGICCNFAKCGVAIEEKRDGFIIHGSKADLKGGQVLDPGKDHRLAMAFILLGLRAKEPIIVERAEIINQSFPGFIHALQKLGVNSIEVLDD